MYTTDRYNLIIGDGDIVIPTLTGSSKMYSRSLLITQIWKLISQKMKILETNGFQILHPDISDCISLRRNYTCTSNIHAQSDAQKHYFIYPKIEQG